MSNQNDAMHMSDESKVAIPLRNLLSILAAVAVSTWAYFGVQERLTKIERDLLVHWEEIEENDEWIDEWKPPEQVQSTIEKVRILEMRILTLELKLEQLSQDK